MTQPAKPKWTVRPRRAYTGTRYWVVGKGPITLDGPNGGEAHFWMREAAVHAAKEQNEADK